MTVKLDKKKKRVITVICAVIVICIALPYALIYAFFGLLAWDMNKPNKPIDHSDDGFIPQGYIKTDGSHGYGAGDYEDFSYYVYEEKPALDEKFSSVSECEDKGLLTRLISRYDEDIVSSITDGDYYYIAELYDRTRRTGALLYFYDNEKNTLYRIDYCW